MKIYLKILLFTALIIFTDYNLYGYTKSDTLNIISYTFTKSTSDSTVILNIDYPQIENLSNDTIIKRINNFLKEEFMQSTYWYDEMIVDSSLVEYAKEYPYSYETGFQVFYNSKNFLSIVLNHYQFTGGAHGNYFAVGYNINLQDGSLLTLNDIIIDGSIDLLTYECEENILDTYQANTLLEAGLFDDEIKLVLDQDFYIIPGAIVLQFDPYEIGPYAMGEIIAEIQFEKISDILKEDLPFPTK